MGIKDIDIRRFEHETGIKRVTLEAAFRREREDASADVIIKGRLNDDTLANKMRLYRYGGIPMGGNLEFALIRSIAKEFLWTARAPTPAAS